MLRRTTLTTAAFEQLISHVVNGKCKAGDKIPPERELCQQLGIARTSLREALKALELIGILDGRVGEGTFVCPRSQFLSRPLLWAFTGTDHEELQDIMEARLLIEESLAGLAAERATESDIEKIGETISEMRDCIKRGEAILEADMAFHLAIATAARNEVLQNAVQLLRNLMRQWILVKLLVPDVPKKVLGCHELIYKAIRRRNHTAAKKAMREHLEETIRLVTHVMEHRQRRMRSARKKTPHGVR